MDKETKQVATEASILDELVQHEGYKIFKTKMLQKVSYLIDITTIDMEVEPSQLAIELKAREKASKIILDLIRIEIEGTIQQAKTNTQPFTLKENDYIIRED
jgi:ribosomal protein S8